ncbi:hypothetical protein [Streptomyces chrestomyceticus]|uniref:hypothetical protein n=1 Tax=Streptomyces chrestomyceticus TaxID=68185 RepID=UPI003F4D576A
MNLSGHGTSQGLRGQLFRTCARLGPCEGETGRGDEEPVAGATLQANAAPHRTVFTRLRHEPRTQAYDERRTHEGKTRREFIRCLKRYTAREVFNLPRTDLTGPLL